jgi:hypothetical protein|tara:strand:+ start:1610 stop:2065 length:456 start_codon:yes stop_codon:yes gene_type:complete
MRMQESIASKLMAITQIDIFKQTRVREYVEARALLMHIFHKYLGMTKSGIAEWFKENGKAMNHATVIHHLNDWDMTVKFNPVLSRNLNDVLGHTGFMDQSLQAKYIIDKAPLLTPENIDELYLQVRCMYEDVLYELEQNPIEKLDRNLIAN